MNAQVKPTTKNPVKVDAITAADINAFVSSKIPMPTINVEQIDTSDIDLTQFRLEDKDVNDIVTQAGWTHIRLVDENGTVVPNARLEITHKSGHAYQMVPFFPAILLARKSTIELGMETQLKSFCNQGSLKARNSFKFIMTPEQQDALQAKAQMNYDAAVVNTTAKFTAWLGEFKPTVAQLEPLFAAFQANGQLVLLPEATYVRLTLQAGSEESVITCEGLQLIAETPDKIGDVLISTAYTYQLV